MEREITQLLHRIRIGDLPNILGERLIPNSQVTEDRLIVLTKMIQEKWDSDPKNNAPFGVKKKLRVYFKEYYNFFFPGDAVISANMRSQEIDPKDNSEKSQRIATLSSFSSDIMMIEFLESSNFLIPNRIYQTHKISKNPSYPELTERVVNVFNAVINTKVTPDNYFEMLIFYGGNGDTE